MRRNSRLIVAVFFVALTLAGIAIPASAQDVTCGGSADFTQGGDGFQGDSFCAGGRPATSSPPVNLAGRWNFFCNEEYESIGEYMPGAEVVLHLDFVLGDEADDFDEIALRGWDPSGRFGFYTVLCVDASGNIVQQYDPYLIVLTEPVPPEDLRDIALARINFPEPIVNELQNLPHAAQIESWFWIENEWVAITDSETAGLVTVEVAAVPSKVEWVPGDGSGVVVCNDPGTVWFPAVNDGGTTCGHVYESGTADVPGLAYTASATIEWELLWWINGIEQPPFGTADETTLFPVPVGEIQIVEVS